MYNAVLGEFIARSRAVKSDLAWAAARELPHRSPGERQIRRTAVRTVEQAHGFTLDAAQSFASSLRKSWVREHLPAQETQSLGRGRLMRCASGTSARRASRDSNP
ncbi:putative transposase [Mycobacterium xenopi 4042]|uniref:Putative transposase n=1 Tax=Mycobacterium xenopi 4042 TaxID=1299334 RepID=X8DAL3_MYCXE|nr:putative transposase [Mycobacterium xenopi 4042]